jgi:hypothetical protein
MKCFIYVQHKHKGHTYLAYKRFFSIATRNAWLKKHKQLTREFSQEAGIFYPYRDLMIPGLMVRYEPLWSIDHSPTTSLGQVQRSFVALSSTYGFVTNYREEVNHDSLSLQRRRNRSGDV